MHYFHICLVAIPDGQEPTEQFISSEVHRLMAPFDEELEVEPYKVYSSQEDIAYMAEHYGTTDVHILATKLMDWDGGMGGGIDEKGLYSTSIRNPQAKYDYWSFGGRWCGEMRAAPRWDDHGNYADEFHTLPENMLPVREIDHKVECHSILTPAGEWFERNIPNDNGVVWYMEAPYWPIKNDTTYKAAFDEKRADIDEYWDSKVVRLLQNHRDCIAVGIDFHI